jgi:hypothetical protein
LPARRRAGNSIFEGELGQQELEEFKEAIADCQPGFTAKWLANNFDKIKVIYAFQVLTAAFEDNNFEIINSVRTRIWNLTGGILRLVFP